MPQDTHALVTGLSEVHLCFLSCLEEISLLSATLSHIPSRWLACKLLGDSPASHLTAEVLEYRYKPPHPHPVPYNEESKLGP